MLKKLVIILSMILALNVYADGYTCKPGCCGHGKDKICKSQ